MFGVSVDRMQEAQTKDAHKGRLSLANALLRRHLRTYYMVKNNPWERLLVEEIRPMRYCKEQPHHTLDISGNHQCS